MHKHLQARFIAAYVGLGALAAFFWIFLPVYTFTSKPDKTEVVHIAQKQLGDLNTARMATTFMAQQADDAGIVVISQKITKVQQPNPNTLIYTIELVGDYGAGRTKYTVSVVVSKGVYRVSKSQLLKQERVQL